MKHDAIHGGYCSCGAFHYPDHLFAPVLPACRECGLGPSIHPQVLATNTHIEINDGRTFEYECDGENCPPRAHDHKPL